MENKRWIIIAVILTISVINYSHLRGNENIRTVQFLSIFVIGALFALLLNEFITFFKGKRV